jgi:hypothetical protein
MTKLTFQVWERGEAYAGFWRGILRERDHYEDPSVDGRIILRWIFRKWDLGHGQDLPVSG